MEGLLDDILELKPHVFCSVPRLWNRIHDRVMGTIRESETSPTRNQLPLLQATVCRGMHLALGSQLWASLRAQCSCCTPQKLQAHALASIDRGLPVACLPALPPACHAC